MLNRIILMGRLVADPELKKTTSGISVTTFRIAVDRSYIKAGEQRKSDFFNIVCWRNSAEFVCKYLTKGSLIALEGKLQSRVYQAEDGANRYITEVVADTVSFTGERRKNLCKSEPSATVPTPEPLPASDTVQTSFTNPEDFPIEEDLPF